ncbi:hypothetical protein VNO77_42239 [Canavalia gladiata]|uniref:Uncharacterized protein n=1 Tax=Canavalia gladiata TaxID=3824 RepID=A0AAN9JZV9_CANGL
MAALPQLQRPPQEPHWNSLHTTYSSANRAIFRRLEPETQGITGENIDLGPFLFLPLCLCTPSRFTIISYPSSPSNG